MVDKFVEDTLAKYQREEAKFVKAMSKVKGLAYDYQCFCNIVTEQLSRHDGPPKPKYILAGEEIQKMMGKAARRMGVTETESPTLMRWDGLRVLPHPDPLHIELVWGLPNGEGEDPNWPGVKLPLGVSQINIKFIT